MDRYNDFPLTQVDYDLVKDIVGMFVHIYRHVWLKSHLVWMVRYRILFRLLLFEFQLLSHRVVVTSSSINPDEFIYEVFLCLKTLGRPRSFLRVKGGRHRTVLVNSAFFRSFNPKPPVLNVTTLDTNSRGREPSLVRCSSGLSSCVFPGVY